MTRASEPKEPTIREFQVADCDAALSLWKRSEGVGLDTDADSKDALARFLERNRSLSFVACENKKIVGAALCGHDGRRGYLHHVAVEKEYRRTGIGKALVNACLTALAIEGIRKCNIFLFSDNTQAESFWKHLEWKERSDLLMMQKPLPGRKKKALKRNSA